jgi:hypothetical protein
MLKNVSEYSQMNEKSEIIKYRLPKSLKPYYYDLKIDIKTFDTQIEPVNYDGEIKIYFNVLNLQVNSVEFHQFELDIVLSSIIVNFNERNINIESTSYDNVTDVFTVNLAEILEVNKNYSIFMKYTGLLKSNNYGFYKSSYVNSNGTKKFNNFNIPK